MILVAALGCLAGAYYFKIYKPKHEREEDDQDEGLENDGYGNEIDEDEENRG